jgi:hypothetical protein
MPSLLPKTLSLDNENPNVWNAQYQGARLLVMS